MSKSSDEGCVTVVIIIVGIFVFSILVAAFDIWLFVTGISIPLLYLTVNFLCGWIYALIHQKGLIKDVMMLESGLVKIKNTTQSVETLMQQCQESGVHGHIEILPQWTYSQYKTKRRYYRYRKY